MQDQEAEDERDRTSDPEPEERHGVNRRGLLVDDVDCDTGLDDASFAEAAALVQTRIVVLGDAWGLLKFFNDADFELDEKSAAKELKPEAAPVLDAALSALEAAGEWTTASIEAALKSALIDGLELKPRKAFGPIRVAVTGASVSPPLFESMELLGRDRSLARLRAAREGV